jgi:hypothetical protein
MHKKNEEEKPTSTAPVSQVRSAGTPFFIAKTGSCTPFKRLVAATIYGKITLTHNNIL